MPVSGVVVVIIDETGRNAATGEDFNRSGYGGFELAKSQEIRATKQAWQKVMTAFCHPEIADAINNDEHLALNSIKHRLEHKGWKAHVVQVSIDQE